MNFKDGFGNILGTFEILKGCLMILQGYGRFIRVYQGFSDRFISEGIIRENQGRTNSVTFLLSVGLGFFCLFVCLVGWF